MFDCQTGTDKNLIIIMNRLPARIRIEDTRWRCKPLSLMGESCLKYGTGIAIQITHHHHADNL